MMLIILLKLCLLVIIIDRSNGYNLDVNFPVIYVDPVQNNPKNQVKSYFGYTTVLFSGTRSRNSWIKIGAPKGLNEIGVQTGVVYTCNITNTNGRIIFSSCSNGFFPKYDNNLSIRSNNSFFGSTIDINPKSGETVSCFPRAIKHISFSDTSRYYMIGGCYSDFNNYKTTLLPYDIANWFVVNGVFYLGHGQVGMSVHISESKVLMGAPGFNNWKGGIIQYDPSTAKTIISLSEYPRNIIDQFNLFGYSVSSGRFFSNNEILYVAGAPRYNNYGMVVIFSILKNDKSYNNIMQMISGTSLGEYFGSSLAVLDINGDGFDDLIVGAPFYSVKYNEGRVYVYISKIKNAGRHLEAPDQGAILEGTIPGGQFGLAIKSLGDLNHDGYNDIVVGAPYEDDRHGVIYIYNGGPQGLNPEPSQIISGKFIHNNLKGFGISFSNAADVDGNNYNDIAVGAHLSGHVVLLRSRPIVQLNLEAKSYDSPLNYDAKEFTINICYNYTGTHSPKEINLNIKINLDTFYKRTYYRENNTKHYEFIKECHLINLQAYCENITFYMQENITHFNTPIKISLTSELIEQIGSDMTIIRGNNNFENEFCKTCPITHERMTPRETTLEIPFDLNCGHDNYCSTDLKVTGQFKELRTNKFIINSKSSLTLEVDVENNGEPAYNTYIKLQLPKNIYLESIPVVCHGAFSDITCNIDNPLQNGNKKSINLTFGVNNIIERTQVEFIVTGYSDGLDMNLEDNTYSFKLDFEVDADIKINGKPDKYSQPYNDTSLLEFVHTYEVIKTGLSPLEGNVLEILVPVKYNENDKYFLNVYEPMGEQDDQKFICSTKDFQFESARRTKMYEMDVTNEQTQTYEMNNLLDSSPEKLQTSMKKSTSTHNNTNNIELPPDNRTLFLNCSNSNIDCIKISCELAPFRKFGYAKLLLSMNLNVTILEPHLKLKDIIYITTHGFIRQMNGQRKDDTTVSTIMLDELKDIQAELWVFIVSAIGGLLILIIFIVVFIKNGFFKRSKKEKLKELQRGEVNQDFIDTEVEESLKNNRRITENSTNIENEPNEC